MDYKIQYSLYLNGKFFSISGFTWYDVSDNNQLQDILDMMKTKLEDDAKDEVMRRGVRLTNEDVIQIRLNSIKS